MFIFSAQDVKENNINYGSHNMCVCVCVYGCSTYHVLHWSCIKTFFPVILSLMCKGTLCGMKNINRNCGFSVMLKKYLFGNMYYEMENLFLNRTYFLLKVKFGQGIQWKLLSYVLGASILINFRTAKRVVFFCN